jgi:hypothetical protein
MFGLGLEDWGVCANPTSPHLEEDTREGNIKNRAFQATNPLRGMDLDSRQRYLEAACIAMPLLQSWSSVSNYRPL